MPNKQTHSNITTKPVTEIGGCPENKKPGHASTTTNVKTKFKTLQPKYQFVPPRKKREGYVNS